MSVYHLYLKIGSSADSFETLLKLLGQLFIFLLLLTVTSFYRFSNILCLFIHLKYLIVRAILISLMFN